MNKELEHLVLMATREPWMTEHAWEEWKRFAWWKANVLAKEFPALYAELPRALTERIKSVSLQSGPAQGHSGGQRHEDL